MSETLRRQVETKITILQGEYKISARADVILSTLLGSCVAMCLFDPVAQIGGLNHFLLPGCGSADEGDRSLRYGAYSMELLVNNLLALGASKHSLRAKLFGGARMLAGLTDLGARNADFAEQYLQRENIPLVGGSLRGDRGRRVEFWPFTGRTRQLLLGGALAPERYPAVPRESAVELF
jgi:chemotaxis protein CheD